MKSNIPCWLLNTGKSRRGIALIITLSIMALLLILAMAFVVNMRTERQVSFNYRRQIEARQAALAGLDTGIAKMAKFYTDAEFSKATVATMAGRFFYTNGVTAGVTIPSGPGRTANGYTNTLMFSWILPGMAGVYSAGFTNWADKVNLNGGNYFWSQNAGQSGSYLPIANPSVNPSRAGTGTSWGPEKPAIWASYLWSNASRSGCKFAFWIDDESSKINLSNAGTPNLSAAPFSYNNVTTNYWTSGTPAYPYATVVQPDPLKHTTKQFSSVDVSMLDLGKVCPLKPYPVANGPWTDVSTLNTIETARNGGTWQPFQTPDEVMSLNTRLTMNDYQAVKSCLTSWSVENTDFSYYFRKGTALIPRTNVAHAITKQIDANALYNFLTGDKYILNADASSSLAKSFGPSTPFYANKYKSSPDNQPYMNGSPNQIAANIVSYLMDPTVSGGQGPIPIGSGQNAAGTPTYTANSSSVPTGSCGLWKAAYMNEIGLSFAWQPVDQAPDIANKKPIKWQLWAALCVELINPYEMKLPISNASYQEQYQIVFDNAQSQLKVNVTCSNPSIPGSINPLPSTLSLNSSAQLDPHTYSAPVAAPINFTNLIYTWPVTPISPTNITPPTITALSVNLPLQIRQMMWNAGGGGKPLDRGSIIDWYSQTTQSKGGLPTLSTLQPTGLTAPQLPFVAANQPPSPVDGAFWGSNPTRCSIAKNDPRVHAWYGPYYGGQVTLGLMNVSSINYVNGDNESSSVLPENRSNFAIANGGMASVGELGFIHTGKPWRSLSLQYYGAQADEQNATANARIPDWTLMDLFTVNSLPIYGRININNGGWHLGNTQTGPYQGSYPSCPTFEERRLFPDHPNLLASWPDAAYQNRFKTAPYNSGNSFWSFMTLRTSAYNGYFYNPITSTEDAASVPLAAALGVIPDYRYRNRLVNYISAYYRVTNTGRNSFAPQGDPADPLFNPNRDTYNPFYSVAQICELPNMNNLFTGNGTTAATTDADKEDVIRRIYGVLTTRGDAFTVHAIGYADSGEARLIAVVERVYDPLAAQLSDRSKFRIRQVRWLTD